MNCEILRTSYPPPEHECELPGPVQRLRYGLKLGARVQCADCGQVWEWRELGRVDPYKLWQRVSDTGTIL